jgi:large subunit ribosomal protein L14|tara:strand:+ start:532 stop:915 length:384 start_codon:yes stop_codon:yes gene_type:complete
MIQKGTFLNVVDNSGAKDVCCIQVLKGYRKRYAVVGDVIIVSIKSLRLKRRLLSKMKKGDVSRALVIRTKVLQRSYTHESLNFLENGAVLLNRQNKLLGTRIFGAVPQKFRFNRFLRIISLASGFVR